MGDCLPSTVNGVYMVDSLLQSSNYIDVQINVSTAGSYNIQTNVVNGYSFRGTGIVSATGLNTVRLQGYGKPIAAETNTFAITYGSSVCTVNISVVPSVTSTTNAVYTLSCATPTFSGTYTAGTSMDTSNTARIAVVVTTPGKYVINTTTVNGITFTGTGVFAAASATAQQVILQASGLAAAAGTFNYPVSGAGSSCSFPLIITAAAAPATYTLAGAPATCTAPVVSGSYLVGTTLNTTNKVVVKVDVTTPGAYTISTNTVNGMKFTGAGTFATAGAGQTVTLTGLGTPLAAGTFIFTPAVGTSGCTFDIAVSTPPATAGTYTCKIDGVFTSFNDRAHAEKDGFLPGQYHLFLDGFIAPADGSTIPEFKIFITNNNNSAVNPGTYNNDGFLLPNGYTIEVDYIAVAPNGTVTIWNTSSSVLSAHPPFTIVVSSVTGNRVKGTFSGKLTDIMLGGTHTKTITEGVFDLPLQ